MNLTGILSYTYFISIILSVMFGCKGSAISNIEKNYVKKDSLYQIGYFNSLSKSNKLVLFKTLYPAYVEGEEHIGDLKIWNLETNKTDVLIDSIPTNIAKSVFVSDSLILIPSYNNILAYDLAKRKSIGSIFILTKDESLLGFALKSNNENFVSVLVNYKTRNAGLILFNLKNKQKKSISISFDFGYTEYFPEPEFYWTDKGIVFSLQNSLYLYNPIVDKIALISDSLEHHFDNTKFAVNDKNIIFKSKNSIYSFSMDDMKILKINSFEPDDEIEFFTGNINNTLKGYVLSRGTYFKIDNLTFTKMGRLPIIQTDSILLFKVHDFKDRFFVQMTKTTKQ
jgi:hypothetical protein